MAQSAAHIKASNKYNSKAYDRVSLMLPKGKRDTIRAYADSQGMSLNNFVCSCLSYCIAQGIDVSATPALTETLPEDTNQ